MELEALVKYGEIGFYLYCEVIQIILDNGEKEYWNYFTHIEFSQKFIGASEREWLMDIPRAINKKFKVMISKEIMAVEDAVNILRNAVNIQEWVWGNDCAKLDGVSAVEPKFVPKIGLTGSIMPANKLVPLEYSLYDSKSAVNYYVYELFSAKEYLMSVLTDIDKKKINNEIKKVRLPFDLYSLSDRMGNVLCKLPIEVIEHRFIHFTQKYGINGQFKLSNLYNNISCYLQIMSTNDHMLIENKVIPVVFVERQSYI